MFLTLQRYLWWDLVRVFVLSLVTVTAVMVVLLVGQVLSRGGVPAIHVLRALPQFLPEVLAFTIPATLLFATTLVYGRFTRDNEFDAVRLSGVHPLVVVVPSVVLGTVLSVVVLYLTAELIPHCRYRVRHLAKNVDVIADIFFNSLDENKVFKDPSGRYTIRASSVSNNVAHDVSIETRERRTGDPQLVLQAERMEFRFNKEEATVSMRAWNAVVETYGANATRAQKKELHELTFPLPPPPEPGPRDLSMGQLLSRIQNEPESVTTAPAPEVSPEDDPDAWREYEKMIDYLRRRRRTMYTEVHLRLNLAVSCLTFILVGVPLAVRFRRGHMLGAFFMALGPMLVFHMLTFQAKNLSIAGTWPPTTPWAANALLLAIAAALFWRMFRR